MDINLNEFVWPISLLKCNAALNDLDVDGELELVVEDVDIVENLIQIINSYPDLSYEVEVSSDNSRIKVRRHGSQIRTRRGHAAQSS